MRQRSVPNATLQQKFEELSARFVALEAEQTRLREENSRLVVENRLLRQKLDQYIRHYFGGQRNEALDKAQLELLLAGLIQCDRATDTRAQARLGRAPRQFASRAAGAGRG